MSRTHHPFSPGDPDDEISKHWVDAQACSVPAPKAYLPGGIIDSDQYNNLCRPGTRCHKTMYPKLMPYRDFISGLGGTK